jgi:hypothetical protein
MLKVDPQPIVSRNLRILLCDSSKHKSYNTDKKPKNDT